MTSGAVRLDFFDDVTVPPSLMFPGSFLFVAPVALSPLPGSTFYPWSRLFYPGFVPIVESDLFPVTCKSRFGLG